MLPSDESTQFIAAFRNRHQVGFNQMVDAGEALANSWMKKEGFHPWEDCYDTRMSPEWQSFIDSSFYRLYRTIIENNKTSQSKEPGRAYKLFRSSIVRELESGEISFKKELLVELLNERLSKIGIGLSLEYTPSISAALPQRMFAAADSGEKRVIATVVDTVRQNCCIQ